MQCEIEGSKIDLLDVILKDPEGLIIKKRSKTDRLNYANRVTTGGFPLVLNSKNLGQRNRWFRDLRVPNPRVSQELPLEVEAKAGKTLVLQFHVKERIRCFDHLDGSENHRYCLDDLP